MLEKWLTGRKVISDSLQRREWTIPAEGTVLTGTNLTARWLQYLPTESMHSPDMITTTSGVRKGFHS